MKSSSSHRVVTLLLAAICAIPFAQAQDYDVVIEVMNTSEVEDDYFCWSPIPARVKLVQPTSDPVEVEIGSESEPDGGSIWFSESSDGRPNQQSFSPEDRISLSLPEDGGWVEFWVAGRRSSRGDKDVSIVVSSGQELARLPVMIRVRKNAVSLDSSEVNQFLAALAQLQEMPNGSQRSVYSKYERIHREAFDLGIHGALAGRPLFLAWHRAFLLDLERELQKVDPRVALPYWRFDSDSTEKLFSPEFMGTVEGSAGATGGFLVRFAPDNPLFGWKVRDAPLVRFRDGTPAPISVEEFGEILEIPFNHSYRGFNGAAESRYHNGAHSRIRGWLASQSSPRDPLFFLLHANVDRAWAHWQAKFDRYNPISDSSYSSQGAYPGAEVEGRHRKGSYALDLMWPWSDDSGSRDNEDQEDDWPLGLSYPMPPAPGSASRPPTPTDMVDYLDVAGRGAAHGTCYDDVTYGTQR